MNSTALMGKKIAILATHGFEQCELEESRRALEEAGAKTQVVSPETGEIRGWSQTNWGSSVLVDVQIAEAQAIHYDALVLPGGVMSPNRLRMDAKSVAFVRAFFAAGKPVGAICHGAWTMIEAEVVHGRKMTSWPSLKTDLRNAGACWVDKEVVEDRNLVTSRRPDDLPAFNRKLIELIAGAQQYSVAS